MKLTEAKLRKIIREILKESTYAGRNSINKLKRDPKYNQLSQTGKKDIETKLKDGDVVDIDENQSEEYIQIAADYKDFEGFIEELIEKLPQLGLEVTFDPDLEDTDMIGVIIAKQGFDFDNVPRWRDDMLKFGGGDDFK